VAGQEAGGEIGDRAQCLGGQRHAPPAQPGRVGEFLPALVEFAERAADPAQEGRAEPVQRHPPAVPLEKRNTELALQPGDRAAQRGLRDPQLGGRPADVLMPGDGLKVTQLKQVHR
jgi:hypothetical protein